MSRRSYFGFAALMAGLDQPTAGRVVLDGVDLGPALAGQPLPGAAPWTHEAADAANTFYSRDDRVQALGHQLADGDVFLEQRCVRLVGVPLGSPRSGIAQAVAVRMDLVSHA